MRRSPPAIPPDYKRIAVEYYIAEVDVAIDPHRYDLTLKGALSLVERYRKQMPDRTFAVMRRTTIVERVE